MDKYMDRNNVINHYADQKENRIEGDRLDSDNAHKSEFITSSIKIGENLKPSSKILELGAGTGKYSYHFAQMGHKVWATDITPEHIEIMKNYIAENKITKVYPMLADARDLSQFKDNSFDCVLCMGPYYHLETKEDKKACIDECLRTLKIGGLFVLAYINKYAIFCNEVCKEHSRVSDINVQNIYKTGLVNDIGDNVFTFSSPSEIEEILDEYDVETISHIGADGLGFLIRNTINKMNKNEFDDWMDYHLATCEDPSLLGYSMHGLLLGRKIKR